MRRFPLPRTAARSGRRRAASMLSAVVLLLTGAANAAAAGPVAAPAARQVSTGVFAIDADHHTVVFVPAAGGTPLPVTAGLTHPTEIAASRRGSVFIVDGTRLLKVTPRGIVLTIRTGMAPDARIAVDDNNWLFVLDGTSIVKYSPRDGSAPVAVGTAPGYPHRNHTAPELTVDAVGNASVTGPEPTLDGEYEHTVITTYPVHGGTPTTRKLVSAVAETNDDIKDPINEVESRDGDIYLEASASTSLGTTDVYRVPPGPAGLAPAYWGLEHLYTEYAFAVDASSNFYLMQNRKYCLTTTSPGTCVDDYGVDFVQRYASFTQSGWVEVDTAVTGVDLPVGGISVSSSGAIYGAVLVSRRAGPTNSTAIPRLLRIDPAGGAAVVLAKGHFSDPVAEDFLWYR